jgi:hypothetical protein
MPEIKITTTVKCLFRDEKHLNTIVETAKEGNAQVLTNILFLMPSGARTRPTIKMLIEQIGQDDVEIDIVQMLTDRYKTVLTEEDPFK